MKRWIALSLALVLLFCHGLERLETGRRAQGKQQLEQALRRCAVACYAAEGRYPPSVAYMTERYGLRYNSHEYEIRYTVLASNLMPDMTVLEKTP